jgi:hypothetical protein
MTDLDRAKEKLVSENLAICIIKDGEAIYTSKEKGIYPIYNAYISMKERLEGASIADRVIGKAAAMICKSAKIKNLYSVIITEQAVKLLEDTTVEFSKVVPYIKNRDQTDLCPIEKISRTTDDTNVLINEIEEFLKKIERIS